MRIKVLMVEFAVPALFREHNEGHEVIIPPRSIITMRLERSKVPFGIIKFKSKSRQPQEFKT